MSEKTFGEQAIEGLPVGTVEDATGLVAKVNAANRIVVVANGIKELQAIVNEMHEKQFSVSPSMMERLIVQLDLTAKDIRDLMMQTIKERCQREIEELTKELQDL